MYRTKKRRSTIELILEEMYDETADETGHWRKCITDERPTKEDRQVITWMKGGPRESSPAQVNQVRRGREPLLGGLVSMDIHHLQPQGVHPPRLHFQRQQLQQHFFVYKQ